jgi:hypothetical protein
MFVQVIEGNVADADALRRQAERWTAELRPGAEGYLGTTAGMSDDGRAYVIARFESQEAAQRNSERPEQAAWWEETAKCYAAEPTFRESADVTTLFGGGSDEAGFVQLMFGNADRAKLEDLDARSEQVLREIRPDLLGGIRAWFGGNDYLEVAYFTSEAEARQNEANMESKLDEYDFGEVMELMSGVQYVDLHEPWLYSA